MEGWLVNFTEPTGCVKNQKNFENDYDYINHNIKAIK